MRRWDTNASDWVERPDIDAFLAEIDEVCKRHGFAIGHEDEQGAFEIHVYAAGDPEWLQEAHVAQVRPSLAKVWGLA